MAEPEYRIVITPTHDGFHFKSPEHQAEVIRHLTTEALGQLSTPARVRVVPAERIEGPSRFTATPAQIDAWLRVHFCEDRIQRYQWAIGDAAAHEAAEEQRTVHAEHNRSIPCAGPGCLVHAVITHIDPATGGGHYPSVLVDLRPSASPSAVPGSTGGA